MYNSWLVRCQNLAVRPNPLLQLDVALCWFDEVWHKMSVGGGLQIGCHGRCFSSGVWINLSAVVSRISVFMNPCVRTGGEHYVLWLCQRSPNNQSPCKCSLLGILPEPSPPCFVWVPLIITSRGVWKILRLPWNSNWTLYSLVTWPNPFPKG